MIVSRAHVAGPTCLRLAPQRLVREQKGSGMGKQYVVTENGCIASLAFEQGFSPDTIWGHPENAKLKELRGDPNVLLAGDLVYVPDLRTKKLSCTVDGKHRFRRHGVPAKFRLQLLDEDLPRAALAYRFECGTAVYEGCTDAEGKLEHWIPPNSTSVRLTLDGHEVFDIRVGYLNPVSEDSGIEGRLANLGYLRSDEAVTPEARASALLAFQHHQGLPETGEVDEQTRDAIRTRHGC
jgi:hypothetical protein